MNKIARPALTQVRSLWGKNVSYSTFIKEKRLNLKEDRYSFGGNRRGSKIENKNLVFS